MKGLMPQVASTNWMVTSSPSKKRKRRSLKGKTGKKRKRAGKAVRTKSDLVGSGNRKCVKRGCKKKKKVKDGFKF